MNDMDYLDECFKKVYTQDELFDVTDRLSKKQFNSALVCAECQARINPYTDDFSIRSNVLPLQEEALSFSFFCEKCSKDTMIYHRFLSLDPENMKEEEDEL